MLRCDTCAAYAKSGEHHGNCHLKPPPQIIDARNEIATPFPEVAADWWCLEHRLKGPASVPNRAAGGHARAAVLTPERRTEIARIAAETRWADHNEDPWGDKLNESQAFDSEDEF